MESSRRHGSILLPMMPEQVGVLTERYLRRVDEALPGRIEGLYLVGSIALDDFKPGSSDIDFVSITRDRLTSRELDRLEKLHASLRVEHRRPWFSGIYVTWADLLCNPVELKDIPFHHEGRFGRSGGFEANPAVWLTLRNFPVSIRGPAPTVWNDPAVLRQWTLDNLNTYWRALATCRHADHRGIGLRRGAAMLSDRAIAWCVPGVTRLHYTITTGDITSKSGACHYALAAFPDRWGSLVVEALAIRNGERKRSGSRLSRRRDALSYMQFVIDDANAIVAASVSRK